MVLDVSRIQNIWQSFYFEEVSFTFELQHDITNKMTCVPSEDWGQPGHLERIGRVFFFVFKPKQPIRSHLNEGYPQNCIFEKDNHLQNYIFTKDNHPLDWKTTTPNQPHKNTELCLQRPLYFCIWTALRRKWGHEVESGSTHYQFVETYWDRMLKLDQLESVEAVQVHCLIVLFLKFWIDALLSF